MEKVNSGKIISTCRNFNYQTKENIECLHQTLCMKQNNDSTTQT